METSRCHFEIRTPFCCRPSSVQASCDWLTDLQAAHFVCRHTSPQFGQLPSVNNTSDIMAAPAMSIRGSALRAQHAVPAARAAAPRSAPFVARPALPLRKVRLRDRRESSTMDAGTGALSDWCPLMRRTACPNRDMLRNEKVTEESYNDSRGPLAVRKLFTLMHAGGEG